MKKYDPKITVLTCCYNASAFIEEAIESILQQSYHNFEYLIVDDGSMDNTVDILKRYAVKDSRIVLIEKQHHGLTASLIVGLRHAKGEWIARLDADDIAMPYRLFNQLEFMKNNNGIVLLGGSCIEIDINGSVIKKHIYPRQHNALMNRLENGKPFFPHSSAFFNKDIINKLGGYNSKFLRSQDWDLWLHIGEVAQIACLNSPVVKLRKHSQMISNTEEGRLQSIMGLCAMVCHFRRKWGLSDPSQLGEKVWNDFLRWIEKRLEDEGVFQLNQAWHHLRNSWYINSQEKKIGNYKSVLINLFNNPWARKALRRRFQKNDIPLKLAEESKNLLYI